MFKMIIAFTSSLVGTIGGMAGAAIGKELYKSAEFLIKGAYIPALFGEDDEDEVEKQKPEKKSQE